MLGKEPSTPTTPEEPWEETSHSLNYQRVGKELMSQDELAVMDGGKCILSCAVCVLSFRIRYDITNTPISSTLPRADDRNAFDDEAFLSARLKLKPMRSAKYMK